MITVYDKSAAVECKKIQELANNLYESLTEFRNNYIIEEDSEKIQITICVSFRCIRRID